MKLEINHNTDLADLLRRIERLEDQSYTIREAKRIEAEAAIMRAAQTMTLQGLADHHGYQRTQLMEKLGFERVVGMLRDAGADERHEVVGDAPASWRARLERTLVPVERLPVYLWLSPPDGRGWVRSSFKPTKQDAELLAELAFESALMGRASTQVMLGVCHPSGWAPGERVLYSKGWHELLCRVDREYRDAVTSGWLRVVECDAAERRDIFVMHGTHGLTPAEKSELGLGHLDIASRGGGVMDVR